MADGETETGRQDRNRVSLTNDCELEYLARRHGIAVDVVRKVVKKVGPRRRRAHGPPVPGHGRAERLVWDVPGARLARIPDARHFVMIDRPGTVAGELGRFLTEKKRLAA